MVEISLAGLPPEFKKIPIQVARPMADLVLPIPPGERDGCALLEDVGVSIIAACGSWGVAAASRMPAAEQPALYVLVGSRSVYCGISGSLRRRAEGTRLFHGCDLVAVHHPMLADPASLTAFERVAYAALAAAGLITAFQAAPVGGAWPGDKKYETLLDLWELARGKIGMFAPGLAAPWLGPLPVAHAEVLRETTPTGRYLWSYAGKKAVVRGYANGFLAVEAGSNRLCDSNFFEGHVQELVHFGALQNDAHRYPTVVLRDLAFPNLQATKRFVMGRVDASRKARQGLRISTI